MPRTQKNKKTLYLDKVFGDENSYLDAIQRATKEEGVERMQISAHEARILQFLVQLSQAKKIVEIGTLYAYSAFHMARALPKDGELFTLDISDKRHEKSQEILRESPEFSKIKWLTGKALDSLKSLEPSAPFDMIFIDADKESYKDYLLWSEKCLKVGGLLVADNTFLFGAVYGEPERTSTKSETIEVMQEFNKRLSHSEMWRGALIPTGEGLTVSIKIA